MPGKSSYVQYLPPVLWAGEDENAPFSLGGMLRIVEKVLTGINDGVQATDSLSAQVAADEPPLDHHHPLGRRCWLASMLGTMRAWPSASPPS